MTDGWKTTTKAGIPRSTLFNSSATCRDCDWKPSNNGTLMAAGRHARQTGHTVEAYQHINMVFHP